MGSSWDKSTAETQRNEAIQRKKDDRGRTRLLLILCHLHICSNFY